MTSTAANLIHCLSEQINILNDVMVDLANMPNIPHDELCYYMRILEQAENEYTLNVLPFAASASNYDEFTKKITSSGICNDVNNVQRFCMRVSRLANCDVATRLSSINSHYSIAQVQSTNMFKCSQCKGPYEMHDTEMVCSLCGYAEKMYTEIYEEESVFVRDVPKSHTKYDPIKHCKFWIERIQALVNDVRADDLESIRDTLANNRIYKNNVSCEIIRFYLKELKLTKYNNNIPQIRKLIYGITPPPLTESELNLLYVNFVLVKTIFNEIKPVEKSNCSYHPYFIYKIIEQILPNNERRRLILECIHLQSQETLIENDLLWFRICDYIPAFTKIPTDNR